MLWSKRREPFHARDIQSETVQAIVQGATVLPPRRFTNAVYTALSANPQVSVADLDDLANRLSRLAWERGRR